MIPYSTLGDPDCIADLGPMPRQPTGNWNECDRQAQEFLHCVGNAKCEVMELSKQQQANSIGIGAGIVILAAGVITACTAGTGAIVIGGVIALAGGTVSTVYIFRFSQTSQDMEAALARLNACWFYNALVVGLNCN